MEKSLNTSKTKAKILLATQENEQEPYLNVCAKTGKALVPGICQVCRRRCCRAGSGVTI